MQTITMKEIKLEVLRARKAIRKNFPAAQFHTAFHDGHKLLVHENGDVTLQVLYFNFVENLAREQRWNVAL